MATTFDGLLLAWAFLMLLAIATRSCEYVSESRTTTQTTQNCCGFRTYTHGNFEGAGRNGQGS